MSRGVRDFSDDFVVDDAARECCWERGAGRLLRRRSSGPAPLPAAQVVPHLPSAPLPHTVNLKPSPILQPHGAARLAACPLALLHPPRSGRRTRTAWRSGRSRWAGGAGGWLCWRLISRFSTQVDAASKQSRCTPQNLRRWTWARTRWATSATERRCPGALRLPLALRSAPAAPRARWRHSPHARIASGLPAVDGSLWRRCLPAAGTSAAARSTPSHPTSTR